MKLKLTKKGLDHFKESLSLMRGTSLHDFVFIYNCEDDPCHAIAHEVIGQDEEGADIYRGYPESFKCTNGVCNIDYHHHYDCNFGPDEEMEVNQAHYDNSPDLQNFVNQGFLEIV